MLRHTESDTSACKRIPRLLRDRNVRTGLSQGFLSGARQASPPPSSRQDQGAGCLRAFPAGKQPPLSMSREVSRFGCTKGNGNEEIHQHMTNLCASLFCRLFLSPTSVPDSSESPRVAAGAKFKNITAGLCNKTCWKWGRGEQGCQTLVSIPRGKEWKPGTAFASYLPSTVTAAVCWIA